MFWWIVGLVLVVGGFASGVEEGLLALTGVLGFVFVYGALGGYDRNGDDF